MKFRCKGTMNSAKKMKLRIFRYIIILFSLLISAQISYAAKPSIRLLKDTLSIEPYDSLIIPAKAYNSNGDSLAIHRIGMLDSAHLGTYPIKIYALDANKISTDTLILVVMVQDKIAPTLQIFGATNITLKQGQTYVEQGYLAIDNFDSMPYVKIGGSFVNTYKAGIFIRSYQAEDFSGNKSPVLYRKITVLDTTSGIAGMNNTPVQVHTYPNPCSNYLQLDISNYQSEEIHMYLYNALGAICKDLVKGRYDKTVFTFDVSNLAKGIYYLGGNIGQQVIYSKVIIQ